MNEYLTLEDGAAFLGVAKRTMFNYIKNGKLTGYRSGVGNQTHVRRDEVEALKQLRPVRREAEEKAS